MIVIYTCILLIILILIIPNYISSHDFHYFNVRTLFLVILFSLIPYTTMSLPVSGMTINKLKEKDFALYLRGFSTDSYESSMMKKISDIHDRSKIGFFKKQKVDVSKLPFSERELAKAVKKYMPIYSVGMTKEVYCPEGSKRIYLDDADWHKGVEYLIKKAKLVFILVNLSDSCIWEILKCKDIAPDKTIYFVDNPECIEELKNKLNYDTIPKCIRYTGKYTFNYVIEGVEHSYIYQNNKLGFLNVLEIYFDDKKASQKIQKSSMTETETPKCNYSRYMPR